MVLFALIVWGLVVLICITILIIKIVRKEYYAEIDIATTSIATTFVIMLVTVLSIPTFTSIKAVEEEVVYEIYSMRVDSGVSGRFVLGSGSVESKLHYYVLVDGEYGYEIEKINAEDLYIIETDEISPRYTTEKKAWEFNFINRLYVPLGTVTVNYSVI